MTFSQFFKIFPVRAHIIGERVLFFAVFCGGKFFQKKFEKLLDSSKFACYYVLNR